MSIPKPPPLPTSTARVPPVPPPAPIATAVPAPLQAVELPPFDETVDESLPEPVIPRAGKVSKPQQAKKSVHWTIRAMLFVTIGWAALLVLSFLWCVVAVRPDPALRAYIDDAQAIAIANATESLWKLETFGYFVVMMLLWTTWLNRRD
jgi:hypothetical protein